MKGKSSLFKRSTAPRLPKDFLQLFSSNKVSEYGKKLQSMVDNQKLKNVIGELYREGATVGDGGTADAVRNEIKTGVLVGGKSHIKKAEERISNLKHIIEREKLNSLILSMLKNILKI